MGCILDALNAGEHEMFILGWSNGTFDADGSTYQLFHSSNHGATGNRAFMTDATVDELIMKAAQENDDAQRMEYYKELQIYLHDLSPWCPFYYKNDNVAFAQTYRASSSTRAQATIWQLPLRKVIAGSKFE